MNEDKEWFTGLMREVLMEDENFLADLEEEYEKDSYIDWEERAKDRCEGWIDEELRYDGLARQIITYVFRDLVDWTELGKDLKSEIEDRVEE